MIPINKKAATGATEQPWISTYNSKKVIQMIVINIIALKQSFHNSLAWGVNNGS